MVERIADLASEDAAFLVNSGEEMVLQLKLFDVLGSQARLSTLVAIKKLAGSQKKVEYSPKEVRLRGGEMQFPFKVTATAGPISFRLLVTGLENPVRWAPARFRALRAPSRLISLPCLLPASCGCFSLSSCVLPTLKFRMVGC